MSVDINKREGPVSWLPQQAGLIATTATRPLKYANVTSGVPRPGAVE
jgi:hypothetical protein